MTMNPHQDSSLLREASWLLGRVLDVAARVVDAVVPLPSAPAPEAAPEAAAKQACVAGPATPTPPPAPMPMSASAVAQTTCAHATARDLKFRGDQLEHVLENLCRRGGFTGAVVADRRGLALAVYNSPVAGDALAAFSTVLGDALVKSAALLGRQGADTIAMDIDDVDKAVLRRFTFACEPYFIMVLCAQAVEPRGEIKASVDEIVGILGA
jgi:hypothetical protein